MWFAITLLVVIAALALYLWRRGASGSGDNFSVAGGSQAALPPDEGRRKRPGSS